MLKTATIQWGTGVGGKTLSNLVVKFRFPAALFFGNQPGSHIQGTKPFCYCHNSNCCDCTVLTKKFDTKDGDCTKNTTFCRLSKAASRTIWPTQSHIQWLLEFFHEGKCSQIVKLTAYLHQLSRLNMSGAVRLSLPFVVMACIGTICPSPFSSCLLYRVIQKERSMFLEVIVSVSVI